MKREKETLHKHEGDTSLINNNMETATNSSFAYQFSLFIWIVVSESRSDSEVWCFRKCCDFNSILTWIPHVQVEARKC